MGNEPEAKFFNRHYFNGMEKVTLELSRGQTFSQFILQNNNENWEPCC